MNTNQSTILDDDAVAELANHPWFWPAHDQWRETPLDLRHVILTVAERDALCATVRALRAEKERLATVSGEWAGLLDRIRAWSKCADGYPLDEHVNNITVDRERLKASRRVHELDNHHNALACGYCAGPIKDEITRLQSQLEQVTKERDDARAENQRLASQLKQWQEEKDTKAGYM